MDERLIDTTLRARVAQWVKAALGELIEEARQDDEESFVASLHSFLNRGEGDMSQIKSAGPDAQQSDNAAP